MKEEPFEADVKQFSSQDAASKSDFATNNKPRERSEFASLTVNVTLHATSWSLCGGSNSGVTNQMQPTWAFNMARIRIFVTQKLEHRVRTTFQDKQILRQ